MEKANVMCDQLAWRTCCSSREAGEYFRSYLPSHVPRKWSPIAANSRCFITVKTNFRIHLSIKRFSTVWLYGSTTPMWYMGAFPWCRQNSFIDNGCEHFTAIYGSTKIHIMKNGITLLNLSQLSDRHNILYVQHESVYDP